MDAWRELSAEAFDSPEQAQFWDLRVYEVIYMSGPERPGDEDRQLGIVGEDQLRTLLKKAASYALFSTPSS